MNILGKKVLLRAIEESDLELLHKWGNDPQTQAAMGNIHFPTSKLFHKNWLMRLEEENLNKRFSIDTDDLGLIGITSITNIDWRNNHAWHGVMLGDKNIRGKGYGYDAVMATMRYAFDELHLERLDGQMIEYNTGSVKFYCDKLGWKREGINRNWYFTQGRYWDRIIVGVTRQDYQELIAKTNYWSI